MKQFLIVEVNSEKRIGSYICMAIDMLVREYFRQKEQTAHIDTQFARECKSKTECIRMLQD